MQNAFFYFAQILHFPKKYDTIDESFTKIKIKIC